MRIKDGFRLEGMQAEINYLGRHGFSGEIFYWRDNDELRRKIKIVETTDRPAEKDDTEAVNQKLFGAICMEWMDSAEHELKIFFKSGAIKRIER